MIVETIEEPAKHYTLCFLHWSKKEGYKWIDLSRDFDNVKDAENYAQLCKQSIYKSCRFMVKEERIIEFIDF